MILAVDTSTDTAGVAVARAGAILGEITWRGRAAHSSSLLPAIERILQASGVGVGEIQALAVATGPGSFSGLRVGVSAVKGLSMALDVPVVGIGTLDTTAWQVAPLSPAVVAVLPAGRAQVYAARYEGRGSGWRQVQPPQILSLDTAAELGQGALLVGEAAEEIAEAARQAGYDPTVAPAAWNIRRPGFLAELGWLYFQSGGSDQRHQLEPLYLRRSAAEEKRAAAQE
jgi:tRNA threonylcarbamoyladenosine biosynthesis protein TsaB